MKVSEESYSPPGSVIFLIPESNILSSVRIYVLSLYQMKTEEKMMALKLNKPLFYS